MSNVGVNVRIASVLKAGAEYRTLNGTYVSQETIMKGGSPVERTLKPSSIYQVKREDFEGYYIMAHDSVREALIKLKLDGFVSLTQGEMLEPAPEGKAYIFPNHWALRFEHPRLYDKAIAERYVASGAWSYLPCERVLVDPNQA